MATELVGHPSRERHIEAVDDRHGTILAAVPDRVMTVGVFRDHSPSQVLKITGTLGLDAAQLHGTEPPEVTAAVAAGVGTVIKVVAAEDPALRSIDEHAADEAFRTASFSPARGTDRSTG